jgi:hypothetical protein
VLAGNAVLFWREKRLPFRIGFADFLVWHNCLPIFCRKWMLNTMKTYFATDSTNPFFDGPPLGLR